MGELAALAASLAWSLNSIQFTLAGRRIGSDVVNRTRLILATLYLSLAHWLLYGQIWPVQAEGFRWGWLGLSGAVGLVLGDACLFRAFVLIGTRRAMLMMTLAPVIGALLAWVWMGEVLRPVEVGAMLLTVGGVAWVVSEKHTADETQPHDAGAYGLGVLLGLGGALGQALGLVVSKQGLIGNFPPLSATLMRMVVASGLIWLLTVGQGQLKTTWQAWHDKKAWGFLIGGALLGPCLGVWMSMVAVQNASVGVASTLMALPPIFLIPLTHWVFHEQISPRSVIGTVVALTGAALIFMT